MPIRSERQYAEMSIKDAGVACIRLNNNITDLAAFRAYKSLRRLLQSLAMKYGYNRNDTRCAVPKGEMLMVARLLEEHGYKNIYRNTEMALKLFDEWRNHCANRNDIITMLKSIDFTWLSDLIDKKTINDLYNNIKDLE
ncbi:hypothetical protein [Picrophilus oshimae]|uniref:Uncharacterized protein n=1 Tax=Picrophilus torridus (strain ATCC 700027 / DSM 9790 / JCM 10055 / NBRC 100828 / KAW 2/3) TaxID=1122961 RepID=A0A8G2L7T2_PICTO|nr:hypothetical protein [Picrophilus oshimae]SMD31438.1 hypothetical protein SAMN02745355_1379 [Picrophilus oshimae DSM 9789]